MPGRVSISTPGCAASRRSGTRGRRPDVARVVVAQQHRFGRRIEDRVVGKRREAVLATVHRPGVRCARRGDDGAEVRVGDHVHPRRRGVVVAVERHDVLAAAVGESSEAGRQVDGRRAPAPGRAGRGCRSAARARRRAHAWPPGAGARRSSWVRSSPRSLGSTTRATASSSAQLGLGQVVAAQQVRPARPMRQRPPRPRVEQRRSAGPGVRRGSWSDPR